jgi:hypothetical protein
MMDPKQALIDMLESIAARDIESARDSLTNLEDWMRCGGFVPEAIHKALDALRFAD